MPDPKKKSGVKTKTHGYGRGAVTNLKKIREKEAIYGPPGPGEKGEGINPAKRTDSSRRAKIRAEIAAKKKKKSSRKTVVGEPGSKERKASEASSKAQKKAAGRKTVVGKAGSKARTAFKTAVRTKNTRGDGKLKVGHRQGPVHYNP